MTATKGKDGERLVSARFYLPDEEALDLLKETRRAHTSISAVCAELARRWLAERKQEKPPSDVEDG